MPVPRARIPLRSTLHAEILGVDNDSYFYLNFQDLKLLKEYEDMTLKMKLLVRGQFNIFRNPPRNPGTDCIVKVDGLRGGEYSRAYIVKESETASDSISCFLVDDQLEVTVAASRIFDTNEEILKFPSFAFKCKLVEMDCFIGSTCLNSLYNNYRKGDRVGGCLQCIVKVLNRQTPTFPTVQITTCDGIDLTDMMQQLIPTCLKLTYPETEDTVLAKIVHSDDEGVFWFRPSGPNKVGNVIKRRLISCTNNLNRPSISVENRKQLASQVRWKDYYFYGAGQLLLYKNPIDQKCYRVRLLDDLTCAFDATAHVFFIDYGCQRKLPCNQLTALHKVDPNLCFIPPQCLPGIFLGAACADGINSKFDHHRFDKFINKSPVSVVVKSYCWLDAVNGDLQYARYTPIVDILVRNPAPYAAPEHPGYSLGEIFHLTDCHQCHVGNAHGEMDLLHEHLVGINANNVELDNGVYSDFTPGGEEKQENDDDNKNLISGVVTLSRRHTRRAKHGGKITHWVEWAVGKLRNKWSPVTVSNIKNDTNDPEY